MRINVQCPKCGAVYQIDDSKIPENGVRARCPKCEHRFLVTRQEELELSPKEKDTVPKKAKWARERMISIGCLSIFILLLFTLLFGNMVIGWFTGYHVSFWDAWIGSDKPKVTVAETVTNSPLDGGVRQVKNYLKANLKDPNSLKVISWSPVAKRGDGGYQVRCKYRAKNSFGGYVISNQVFVMDSNGNVINVFNFGE